MDKTKMNKPKQSTDMHELKCPKCGSVFTVDEADYASIVSQVRGTEFNAEVQRRLEELHAKYEAEQKAKAVTAQQEHQTELFKKEQSILAKDGEIANLKAQLNAMDDRQKLAVGTAVAAKNEEIAKLNASILQLRSSAQLAAKEAELHEDNVRKEYEAKLKVAQEQVDYYKDLKTRLSTKMIGETLEAHCSNTFNGEMRPLFPNAYFEKDNDASGGSKGDFIFRDYEDDTEYVSIMFEMKNEADETATKHKNEDFLKKLDADRNAKGCEYAVLVSLLEPDSELYNGGIVDMSWKYPKMYVIRPQFFKAMITLLVNASKKSVGLKKELELARRQSVDVTHFEEQLLDFKDKFSKNVIDAKNRYDEAIDGIDRTIKSLEKIKESLRVSSGHLNAANNKVALLSIKGLTKDNETMSRKFDEARKAREAAALAAGPDEQNQP